MSQPLDIGEDCLGQIQNFDELKGTLDYIRYYFSFSDVGINTGGSHRDFLIL